MVVDCYHLREGACELGRDDEDCLTCCIGYIRRQRCEVWTRVMGYHRPTTAFNIGKLKEHEDRKHFVERPA